MSEDNQEETIRLLGMQLHEARNFARSYRKDLRNRCSDEIWNTYYAKDEELFPWLKEKD
jgi:hypothetical protein